jgi:hypothetical protein
MRLANRIRALERKTEAAFVRWLQSDTSAPGDARLDAASVAEARRELAELLGISEEQLPPAQW